MKKFILSLFVGFVGIISFCSAEFIGSFNCNTTDKQCGQINSPTCNGTYTVYFESTNNGSFSLRYGTHAVTSTTTRTIDVDCGSSILVQGPFFSYPDSNFTVNYGTDPNGGSCPECPTCPEIPECPEVNTGEILSGYILESEIDTNYCVGNGLCPNECGSGSDLSGDLQYSNIYINSILHPGKQNIFIDIPDYIIRDYNSTGDDFNLYVGSGYDVDYINSIIDINSYRPSSSDFTNIFVSGLTLIFPYIFITLLLLFIWKFIKKFFK